MLTNTNRTLIKLPEPILRNKFITYRRVRNEHYVLVNDSELIIYKMDEEGKFKEYDRVRQYLNDDHVVILRDADDSNHPILWMPKSKHIQTCFRNLSFNIYVESYDEDNQLKYIPAKLLGDNICGDIMIQDMQNLSTIRTIWIQGINETFPYIFEHTERIFRIDGHYYIVTCDKCSSIYSIYETNLSFTRTWLIFRIDSIEEIRTSSIKYVPEIKTLVLMSCNSIFTFKLTNHKCKHVKFEVNNSRNHFIYSRVDDEFILFNNRRMTIYDRKLNQKDSCGGIVIDETLTGIFESGDLGICALQTKGAIISVKFFKNSFELLYNYVPKFRVSELECQLGEYRRKSRELISTNKKLVSRYSQFIFDYERRQKHIKRMMKKMKTIKV